MLNKRRHFIRKDHTVQRIIFFAEDVTLAHVTRPLVLANSLDRHRYEIFFATGERYRYLLENLGHSLYTIPTLSSQIFLDRLAKGQPVYTKDDLKASVKADLELLSELSPDLVIGDFRLSLGISAKLAEIPYAALTNAHWSPYSTLSFPLPEHRLVNIFGVRTSRFFLKILQPIIFKYHAASFNSLRKTSGLEPLKDLREVYTCGDWTLYLDLPALAPTSNIPDNHSYLGPVLWSPDIPLPEWWNGIPKDKPVLYVTLGSSGDIRFMDVIIDTLGKMPVTAIVASAGRFEPSHLPDNIFAEKYLPGLEASKMASLVVCSGGTATTYQAISCGVPVLGIPSNADQYLSMEAIVKQEAGLLIRSGKVTGRNIRKGIETILENAEYKQNANRLKNEILLYNAPERFSSFVDSLDKRI
jgi:UDP:flavonoid glycosyltransferase YjiC (YdhE family)